MDEAAPIIEENPVFKRSRNIRLKGSPPERKSRRISGETPDEIGDLDNIGGEVKNLKHRGGKGGRWFDDDPSKWNYFPDTQSYLSSKERNNHNASVVQDLTNEVDEDLQLECDDIDESKNNYSTYKNLNLQSIQDTVNKQCIC